MPGEQLSPPMRGRGLKLVFDEDDESASWSPPMRGRGLKLEEKELRVLVGVAPHAGAWIETSAWRRLRRRKPSPPMRGRGLKPGT